MASAAKVLVAASVVALFGGFLLAGVIGEGDDGAVLPPAAETQEPAEASVPTAFSGTFQCSMDWTDGATTNVVVGAVEGGNLVRRETRGGSGRFNAEMSDPRLQGVWTAYDAMDEYFWPGIDASDALTLAPGVMRIVNDGGWWEMPWGWSWLPGLGAGGDGEDLAYLEGGGGYDGMSALFRLTGGMSSDYCYCFESKGLTPEAQRCSWQVEGLILEDTRPVVEVSE